PRWPEPYRLDFPGSDNVGLAFGHAVLPCESGIAIARVHIRGTLETRRVNTSVWVGLDGGTPRLRLGSVDTTTPPIDLVAMYSHDSNGQDEGTLVLPTRRWVVRSRSRDLVELVLGVPLSALDLQSLLTGCPAAPNGNVNFEL